MVLCSVNVWKKSTLKFVSLLFGVRSFVEFLLKGLLKLHVCGVESSIKAQIVKLSSSFPCPLGLCRDKNHKMSFRSFPYIFCVTLRYIYFHLKSANGLHVYCLICQACFHSSYVHLKIYNFIACLWMVLKSVYSDFYWWVFRCSVFSVMW